MRGSSSCRFARVRNALVVVVATAMQWGCSSNPPQPVGPPGRDSAIVEKVEEAGFRAPKLYAGRLEAGSVLASLEDETVFATADSLNVEPSVSSAAFLKNWKSTSTIDNTFDLELLVSGSKPEGSGNLGLELGRSGVTHYSITIGEAHLEAVSDMEIRSRVNAGQLPTDAIDAIRAGQPVIVEALRVDSIRVELKGEGKGGVALSVKALNDLFGTHAKLMNETEAGGVPIQVDAPVYIGFKARALFVPPQPPPAKATEDEPNDDRSSADPIRSNGSARGAVHPESDPFDIWVIEPDQTGTLTVVAGTTGGKKANSIRRVNILDDAGNVLAKSGNRPFLPGKEVQIGPVQVTAGQRYLVDVRAKSKTGGLAKYKLETSFQAD